nr:MAG TPA: hypothetical protein [Caudoviricetes sp.]
MKKQCRPFCKQNFYKKRLVSVFLLKKQCRPFCLQKICIV